MPKTLAEGRVRVTILTAKPADPANLTAEEVKAGKNITCQILKSGYKLGATASDTVNEPALCAVGNAQAFGAANYEGELTVFDYRQADGKPDAAEGTALNALKTRGTTLWIVEREGPIESKEIVAGDIVDLYEVITDSPQKPQERSGYIKRTIPLGVQQAWEGITLK